MKLEIDTVKIVMHHEDVEALKLEIRALIADIESDSIALGGYFSEALFRERHPKINELLNVLEVRNELPF